MRTTTTPSLVSPGAVAIDRDTPTPRLSLRTAVFLDGTIELLGKIGERPGITYDRIRGELHVLEDEFRGWANKEPDIEHRLKAAAALTGLLERVHGLARGERCLETTIELLAQLRERPGLTYERLRHALRELGEELRTWPDREPSPEARLATLAGFGDLQDQVQSLARGAR